MSALLKGLLETSEKVFSNSMYLSHGFDIKVTMKEKYCFGLKQLSTSANKILHCRDGIGLTGGGFEDGKQF